MDYSRNECVLKEEVTGYVRMLTQMGLQLLQNAESRILRTDQLRLETADSF